MRSVSTQNAVSTAPMPPDASFSRVLYSPDGSIKTVCWPARGAAAARRAGGTRGGGGASQRRAQLRTRLPVVRAVLSGAQQADPLRRPVPSEAAGTRPVQDRPGTTVDETSADPQPRLILRQNPKPLVIRVERGPLGHRIGTLDGECRKNGPRASGLQSEMLRRDPGRHLRSSGLIATRAARKEPGSPQGQGGIRARTRFRRATDRPSARPLHRSRRRSPRRARPRSAAARRDSLGR